MWMFFWQSPRFLRLQYNTLIQKAEKGNLEAQFQLYEYYDKGKHVDKDEILAQKYLKLLENTLTDKSLRLKWSSSYQASNV